jgi:hypothetical protein
LVHNVALGSLTTEHHLDAMIDTGDSGWRGPRVTSKGATSVRFASFERRIVDPPVETYVSTDEFEGFADKVYTPYRCRTGREDAGRSEPHRIAQPPSFPVWRRALL